MLWKISQQCTVAPLPLVHVLLLVFSTLQRWTRVAMVPIAVLMPPGISFFILLQHRGSFSSSISFFFFFQMQKKSLYSHNKNKSVLYFTIYFKYFHYEALISPTWSRSIQPFPETELPGACLGRTPRTAALHHLLNLVHKGGPVSAFERVFPPLASQRSTALPSCTPTSAL